MPSEPSSFILSLPKAELHLHLEGSIEPSTLLELRQRHGMEGASLAEVEQLYNYDKEVSHNAIEVYVHRLRKKIIGAGVTVRTLYGRGYALDYMSH